MAEGILYWQALNRAMDLAMEADKSVFTLGEDVGLYGGTYRLFTTITERHGVEVSFVDTSDPDAVAAARTSTIRMMSAATLPSCWARVPCPPSASWICINHWSVVCWVSKIPAS